MTSQIIGSVSRARSAADQEFEALVRKAKIQTDPLPSSVGIHSPQNRSTQDSCSTGQTTPAGPAAVAGPVEDPKEKVTEAVCEECRKIFAKGEMSRCKEVWVCSACKPDYLQKMGLGTSNHAGLMVRLFAKFLDGVIIFLFFLMPFVIHAIWAARDGDLSRFETLPQFLFFGYHMAYVFYSIFFIGRFGATPGKMLCKLKVVTADGDRVGYGRAIGRFFAELASEALLFSGYIMAAFHEKRLALHDRLCNTVVLFDEKAKKPTALHPPLTGGVTLDHAPVT